METTLIELTPYRIPVEYPTTFPLIDGEILQVKRDLVSYHFYDLFEFGRLIRSTGTREGEKIPEIKFDITPLLPSIKINGEEYFEKYNLWEYVERLRGSPKPNIRHEEMSGLDFCALTLSDEDFTCVYRNLELFICNYSNIVTITTPTKVEEVLDLLSPGINRVWKRRSVSSTILDEVKTILEEVVVKPIKRKMDDIDRPMSDGFDSLIAEALERDPNLYVGQLLSAVEDLLNHSSPQPGCIAFTKHASSTLIIERIRKAYDKIKNRL